VWSDVLQHAERLHLLRVSLWGGLSTIAGTALLVITVMRTRGPTILRGFASICVLFGVVQLAVATIAYRAVGLRDVSAATRLDRLAWLQLGLYLGVAGVGLALALAARRAGLAMPSRARALATMGAGVAVALHGLGLATLELLLIANISR
jgi:hypothetical protein